MPDDFKADDFVADAPPQGASTAVAEPPASTSDFVPDPPQPLGPPKPPTFGEAMLDAVNPRNIYAGYKSELSDLAEAAQRPLTQDLPEPVRNVVKRIGPGGVVEGIGKTIPGPVGKAVQGVGTGLEDVGESLTSPLSIALAGEGFLAKAPLLVQRIASGAFALQSAVGGIKEIEPLREAIKNGDWTEAAHIGTGILANAFIAGLAGTHAIKGSPAVPPPILPGEAGAAPGTPPPIPPRPEPADLLKAEINKAKKSGTWSPELRAFVTGIDPALAGTTPEKVAAFAKSVGMDYYKPVPSAALVPPPIPKPPTPRAPNAETVRGNQEIIPTPGQVIEGGQETGRNDLQQKPSIQPEPVAQREEVQNAPAQAQPNPPVVAPVVTPTVLTPSPNAIPERPPLPPTVPAQAPVTPPAASIQPAVAPAPTKETIIAAAIKMPDGSIRTGRMHPLIEGFKDFSSEQMGFVTNTGRFVTRDEANAISGKDIAKGKEFQEGVGRFTFPEDAEKEAGKHSGDYPFSKEPSAPPLNPGGELASLPPDLQAKSNAVKEKMAADLEKLRAVRPPLAQGQSEISKDQALAISGGSKKLLPKPGETKPQIQDSTGEYFIGQTDDKRFFTEHRPKPIEATAVNKIESQVQKVADIRGQRPAKEVKNEIVSRIEEAIANAPKESELTPEQQAALVEVRKFSPAMGTNSAGLEFQQREATTKVQATGLKKVMIDIPGDGTFEVWNTKETLSQLLERAKKLDTSSQKATPIQRSGISKSDKAEVEKMLANPAQASLTEPGSEERQVNEGEAKGGADIRALLEQSGYPKNLIDTAVALLDRLEQAGADMSDWRLRIQQDSEGGKVAGYRLNNLIVLTSEAHAASFPEEVYHMLYDMLTDEEQAGINELRLAELRKIYGDNITSRLASGNMTSDEFLAADIPREQYHLINPSEFMSQFSSNEFAKEAFQGRNKPGSWYERLRDKIRHLIRTIVNFFKGEKKARPDLRQSYEKMTNFNFKQTPETGRIFEDEMKKREASLAVNPKQYQKQEAFGERALPERTLAAYGDLSMIKNREADAIGASEQARKMVAIPNQDLLASMASADLAVNRFVLDNYAKMKARVAGSDPGLKWSVTQDALHGLENEKADMAKVSALFDKQSEKVNRPGFLKSVQRMLDRETTAKMTEQALATYKSQMAQSAGDIIRELDTKGKTEAQYDQLRSDYQRIQKMTQFSEAVAQRVQDIIDTVSGTTGGLQAMYVTDKTGTNIYNLYLHAKATEAEAFQRPGLTSEQKIFARLASQVLAANNTLRWDMASKAHMLANPAFKAAVTAAGEKFRKAFEKDPAKGIAQIIKATANLTDKAVTAEAAWVRMQKQVLPQLQRYENLRQAVEINQRVAASPEFKALSNQLYADAGEGTTPVPLSEIGKVTPESIRNAFDSVQTFKSPSGVEYKINIGYTKATAAAAQAQMNAFLDDIGAWLFDPVNDQSPDQQYWQNRYDFVKNAVNVSSVLNPTANQSAPIRHGLTMMDFLFKEANLPAAKLAWIAGGNWFRSFNVGDQWYAGAYAKWQTLARDAMKSHQMNPLTDQAIYQRRVLGRIASQYRRGNALKIGSKLNNGMVVTSADLDFFKYQGQKGNELFKLVRNLGREGVMGPELVLDQWKKNVFLLRAAQELGAEKGTTLPHEFSQSQAVGLAAAISRMPEHDYKAMESLLNEPEIFEDFVGQFIGERGADYSTLTPFEDLYKEISDKWTNNAPDAPKTIAEIVDYIDSRTTAEYTPDIIRKTILDEMEAVNRWFHKQNEGMDKAGDDVRAIRATKDTSFTKGHQKEIGSAWFYDYGAMTVPEVRAMAVDSSNFHLVQFVKALDSTLIAYDAALADKKLYGDPTKFTEAQMKKFRAGEDFRNFERLETERKQVAYFKEQIATAYGSSQQAIVDLFSPVGGLLRTMTSMALNGFGTSAKIALGSTFKAGLVLQAYEGFAMMSYAKNVASFVMSAANLGLAGPVVGAAKGTMATVSALKAGEGVRNSVLQGLESAIEGMFRQGKFFNRQYEYGLGSKQPVGFAAFNQLFMPYSEGMGYDPKLFKNILLRTPQKAFYRLLSLKRAPLEFTKAIFPQLFYAMSYDAVARSGFWTIKGMAAQARKAFEYLEKTGGFAAFDLNNPSSLKNRLAAEHVIPRGILAPDQTNLNFVLDWWQRAVDVPLQETVMNYWKALAATPPEKRGEVSFLASDKTGAEIQHTEEARLGGLLSVLLKDVHHASPENRPLILRTDKTIRFLFPLVGWTSQSTRDTAYRFGHAPGGNIYKTAMLVAAGILATAIAAVGFAEAEKESRKFLAWMKGQEIPEKTLFEASNKMEQAKLLALDLSFFIPQLNDFMSGLLSESSSGPSVFALEKIRSVFRYLGGVIHTGDWSYGLARFASQMDPLMGFFIAKMKSQRGLMASAAVQQMVRKYGPQEVSRFVGGYAVPTELSPFKERLKNAIFSGDTADVQKRMDDFVAQAVAMGKSPEEAQKILAQAVVSLNPIQVGSSKMTDQQRTDFLARLNPDQLKIEQAAESNYEAAEGMVGRTTGLTKQVAGGGYSAGGGSIPGVTGGVTGGRTRGGSGIPGVPSASGGVSGGRIRGSSRPVNRIRGRGSVRNTSKIRGMKAPRLRRTASHYRSANRIRRSHHKTLA